MSSDPIRRTISDFYAALGNLDSAAWLASFADNAESRDPADSPPRRGRDELAGFFDDIVGLFDNIQVLAKETFVNGRHAAVKFHVEGYGKNGRLVSFSGIDVFEFDAQARITRLRGYWDAAAVIQALSTLPA